MLPEYQGCQGREGVSGGHGSQRRGNEQPGEDCGRAPFVRLDGFVLCFKGQ
jgi:hypothetical protein